MHGKPKVDGIAVSSLWAAPIRFTLLRYALIVSDRSAEIWQRFINLIPLLLLFAALPGIAHAQDQGGRGSTRSPHGPLAIACESCHTSTSWKPLRPKPEFNHSETRFPLRGMHVSVDCRQCHTKLVFNNVGTKCADCHADLHKRQFGTKCEECHTVRGWQVSMQSVKQHQNRFPLLGAHAAVDCESCHKGAAVGRFTGLSTDCGSCHLREFQTTKVLDHVAAKLPTQCDQCHRMDSWRGGTFDHARFTGFVLDGAHTRLECANCHAGNRYAGTPANCFGCHLNDFTRTTNPNHVEAGFPRDCAGCHNTSTWMGATFNHNTMTKFPLTGAHKQTNCEQCHSGGRYVAISTDCFSCHAKEFNTTTNPNHKTGNLPTDCLGCHTTDNWLNARFDHNTLTKFPLTGAHVSVACKDCHSAGSIYSAASTACQSCHMADFTRTTNPNHVKAAFPQDCSLCHTTVAGWAGATFNHNTATKFPLTGAHVPLNCADCHKNDVFVGLSMTCVSCHLTDFNNSKNPNHVAAGFPQECAVCHTTTQWKGAKFDHNTTTKFPLTGAHIPLACADCHKNNVFTGLSTGCVTCHLTDFNNSKNPNHVAAGFPQECAVCHTTTQWKGAKFDHNTTTKFPLTGAHIPLACADCHKNNVFSGLSTGCVSCHLTEFNNSKSPNHVAAGFPQDCQICHTTAKWSGAKFDHSKTRFPLTGAHAAVDCQHCHGNNQYASLSTACATCHLTDFNNSKNPNHVAAGFPQDCAVCHNTTQWKGATFNHNTATKFPLTGVHVSVTCQQCHKNNVFAGLATSCISCHMADWKAATNPNHAAAGFPQDCTLCHAVTAGWAGAKFNHNTATKFPLTGVHVSVQCEQCHKNNVFAGLAMTCISCHMADWNAATNPPHAAAGFPQNCTQCHAVVAGWAGATFNHNTATKFPLTGAHVSVTCTQCHKNGVFAGLAMTCISCHMADWNAATNPPHAAAGFPQNCTQCHAVVAGWAGATFNHNTATKFPLTGAHVSVTCTQCHKNGVFAGLAMTCISCHMADWNAATNPPHAASGFPQDCTQCHAVVAGWAGATFNHNTATKFPLTGAHVSVQCAQCHKNGVFAGLAMTCISCHLADYNGANNPSHTAAAFPQDCTLCHTMVAGWGGATFNHTTQTKFPLTGVHGSVSCDQCHKNNVFAGLATTCISCHMADWNAATNPNHASAGFPQDCAQCHAVVAAWAGATFNHNTATRFPLTGAHVSVSCTSCHKNNVFAGTSTACSACHLAAYTATTNPNHAAAGFPQDCSLCHTTTAGWGGATFNHTTQTKFPLTGAHVSVQCTVCHKNNVFAGLAMTCLSCHQADLNSTNNPNHVAAGFPQDCSVCHTTVAGWGGAKFTHPTTPFALTGAHTTVACTLCHINNNFASTPTDCYSCHSAEYNGTTNPNHKTAGFPTTCGTCHAVVAGWGGATFNHTYFPVNHGRANGVCATCHTNPSNYTVFQCTNCHTQASTDREHSGNRNYVYNSINCYACHRNGNG